MFLIITEFFVIITLMMLFISILHIPFVILYSESKDANELKDKTDYNNYDERKIYNKKSKKLQTIKEFITDPL